MSEGKLELPPNIGALTDALIDVCVRHGLRETMASINARFDADTIDAAASNAEVSTMRDSNLTLALCFFSDTIRKWETSAALARLFKKEGKAADASAYDRDAYRAAECFRRLGAKCDLRDERGEIVNLRH